MLLLMADLARATLQIPDMFAVSALILAMAVAGIVIISVNLKKKSS